MSDDSNFDILIDRQYLTLIMRLLSDNHGQFQAGVLIDLNEETVGSFNRLDELPDLIAHWLKTRSKEQDSAAPDDPPETPNGCPDSILLLNNCRKSPSDQ